MTARQARPPRRNGRPRPFRSILIASDLSAITDRLVGRVARLPVADDARITLVHVLPEGLPARTQRIEERHARAVLEDAAESLARRLPGGATIRTEVRVGTPVSHVSRRALALKADLLVMGVGSAESLRWMFLGTTAERVLRITRIPVLVVRNRPGAPYRRPAAAVDTANGVSDIVRALLRILGEPRPIAHVIHAFETPYGGLILRRMAPDAQAGYVERHRARATRALTWALGDALVGAGAARGRLPRWVTHVRQGSARRVIIDGVRDVGADLLVMGTRAYTGTAHAFLGTIAGDVLRRVRCDVLVVPYRRRSS